MKILVLSDSHSALSFMRLCIDSVKPDVMIHLGDYVKDADSIGEFYPAIRMYQVPGNCDSYRLERSMPEILYPSIGGVDIYMTHGHKHGVKVFLDKLLSDARAAGAKAALYGHTHIADCHQEDDGLWVLNPGSCGYYGGSAGIIEIDSRKITACRIVRQADLEDLQ